MRNTDVLAKPSALDVLVDTIPLPMRELPQWVVWSWVWSKRRGQWDKPPKRPDGRAASSTDPATWSTFDEVMAAYSQHKIDGIGFVLTEESGIVGIDIDNCRNGSVKPWAIEILTNLKTYTEVSPSGTGVRAFCIAKLPGSGRKKGPIEVYAEGRYLTVTGNRISHTETLQGRDKEVSQLWDQLGTVRVAAPVQAPSGGEVSVSDYDLLMHARQAKHGAEFWDLYSGSLGGKPSNSEADLALCNRLAFWTNHDAARMDRIFRNSGLMRDKWDERRGELTYGEITIAKAIADTPEGYTGWPVPVVGEAAQEPGTAAQKLVIRTLRELRALPAADVNWITERFLAEGAITELSGWVKAGKSTLMTQLVASVIHGRPFLGLYDSQASPVVILTEERHQSLLAAMEEAGVDEGDDHVHVVMWHEAAGLPWDQALTEAVARARELKAGLLVVDTLGRWSGVEDENDAAQAAKAMAPIQREAVGIAILVLRQAGKTMREVQNAGRGSSAYAGGADILLSLQHNRSDNGHILEEDPTRWLSVISRFERDQVPRMHLSYEHRTYRAIEATQVDQTSTEAVFADLRTHGPSRPLDVVQRTDMKAGTVRQALLRLVRRGRVEHEAGVYSPRVTGGVTGGVTQVPADPIPTQSDTELPRTLHFPIASGDRREAVTRLAPPDLQPHEVCHRHGGPYWERQASNGGGWVCSKCQGDDPRELKRQWVLQS